MRAAPSRSSSTGVSAANSAPQVSTDLNDRSPAKAASGSSARACNSRRNHGSISVASCASSTDAPLTEDLEEHVVAVGGRHAQVVQQFSGVAGDVGRDVELARAHRLGERLPEGPADRHHLPHALHVRGEPSVDAGELLEGEPRPLDDGVVDGRLEGRRRRPGDVVRDLVRACSRRRGARRSWRSGSPSPSMPALEIATRAGSSR